ATDPWPVIRDTVAPTPAAISRARAATHEVCTAWDLRSLEKAAQSVMTELVTNAITHAGTRIELTWTRADQVLYLPVTEEDPGRPHRRFDEDGGYGIALVDAFSARWEVLPRPVGKTVWAALRLR